MYLINQVVQYFTAKTATIKIVIFLPKKKDFHSCCPKINHFSFILFTKLLAIHLSSYKNDANQEHNFMPVNSCYFSAEKLNFCYLSKSAQVNHDPYKFVSEIKVIKDVKNQILFLYDQLIKGNNNKRQRGTVNKSPNFKSTRNLSCHEIQGTNLSKMSSLDKSFTSCESKRTCEKESVL